MFLPEQLKISLSDQLIISLSDQLIILGRVSSIRQLSYARAREFGLAIVYNRVQHFLPVLRIAELQLAGEHLLDVHVVRDPVQHETVVNLFLVICTLHTLEEPYPVPEI